MSRAATGCVLLLMALISGHVLGQARAPLTAEISAGTVPLGSTFELRVKVEVPAGSKVHFPDKLPATEAVESHGAVRSKSDGSTLSLVYPLIALGIGDVEVPAFDITVGPATVSVPPRRVRVASIFQLEGVLAGMGPMPAADVVGRSWNVPSLVLLLASSCVLVVVLVMAVRTRRARTPEIAAPRLEDAKREALRDLDSLLARGLHTSGRLREFYTASSGIVRRYAERLDARWSSALTTTELMRDLRSDELAAEMSSAEVVKFGQWRPELAAAEAHWRAVREWIGKSEGDPLGH